MVLDLVAGQAFLASHGLNLFAVLDRAELASEVSQVLDTLADSALTRVVLVGSGGPQLWQAVAEFGLQREHPVDELSGHLTDIFIGDYLDSPPIQILYPQPADARLPIQQLGRAAGWHHDSPLGLGIHPDYGLWFAYRSVFVTSLELPTQSVVQAASPCEACLEKPCISACPVDAASSMAAFDIPACTGFRLRDASPCRHQCLARIACPVGAAHRYSSAQQHYHYDRSLRNLQAYQARASIAS